ncbi:MAG: RsmG family class I SAM-dependent methyltransferase [Bacteroidota bacterium]
MTPGSDHHVSRETLAKEGLSELRSLFAKQEKKFVQYAGLISWWNQKINIVSRDASLNVINKHIVHSAVLALHPAARGARCLLDVGTGGGLPGVPLAISRDYYGGQDDQSIVLCDKVEKKLWAVKQIISKLGLNNVTTLTKDIKHLRWQDIAGEQESVSRETSAGRNTNTVVVSKHAFKFDDLLRSIPKEVAKECLLLKGLEEAEEELHGVEEPFSAKLYPLEPFFGDAFYKGKAMVYLRRE